MVKRRVHDDERHVHIVTFSCYKRRRLLESDLAARIVIGHLGKWLARHEGICIGFVVMPDHVHALNWFEEPGKLSSFMNQWKEQSSKGLKNLFRDRFPEYWSTIDPSDPIWQARYYGLNLWSRSKVEEKLNYMHLNPVRAGLVEHPSQWKWSSARWYADRKSVGVRIRWPPGLEMSDEFVV